MNDVIQKLEKLAELRDKGVLTEVEFQAQKAKVLSHKIIKKPTSESSSSVLDELSDLDIYCKTTSTTEEQLDNKVNPKSKVNIQKILVGAFLLIIIFFWFTSENQSNDKTNSQQKTLNEAVTVVHSQSTTINNSNIEPSSDAVIVEMDKLISDYEANEVAADNEYKNKRLSITGTVAKVSVSLGDGYVTFNDNLGNSLGARFTKNNYSNYLSKLHIGDQIVLNCLCNGVVLIDPYLTDCKPDKEE